MSVTDMIAPFCRDLELFPELYLCSVETARFEAVDESALKSLLGPRELVDWHERFGSKARRIEWLAGRVAGKYALYLSQAGESKADPEPDRIEILSHEGGAPFYAGPWKPVSGRLPELSIAHTGGLAVAMADRVSDGFYPGIDVERKERRFSRRVIEEIFSLEEENFLRPLEQPEEGEWRLRLWCAREAAAKSLRMGLVGMTRHFQAEEIDFKTGKVYVAVSGLPEGGTPFGNRCTIPVHTFIYGEYILAVSLIH